MIRNAIAAALALALAACGKAAPESDDPAPAGSQPGDAEVAQVTAAAGAAPASFAQCRTCHQVTPGKHGVGPSLAGVYGKPAGSMPGYTYSSAMKASGLIWDDATLGTFLEAPVKTVPGTKMVYPGLKDAEKRAELIAYLKTI
jgi:cytochrome c